MLRLLLLYIKVIILYYLFLYHLSCPVNYDCIFCFCSLKTLICQYPATGVVKESLRKSCLLVPRSQIPRYWVLYELTEHLQEDKSVSILSFCLLDYFLSKWYWLILSVLHPWAIDLNLSCSHNSLESKKPP